jgi:hypothetical protein
MSHIYGNDEYRSQAVATNRKISSFVVSRLFFFTGLSLRLRADISKVTAHERIQHLYESSPAC